MFRNAFYLLRDAGIRFAEDRATLFAATLAYYTIFSLAPLLVIAVSVAGFFVGRSVAQEEISSTITAVAGPQIASFVQGIAVEMANTATTTAFTLIGIAILIYGASGIFNSLRHSINFMWGIAAGGRKGIGGVLSEIKSRALTFLMVFLMGLLLVAVVLADLLFGMVEMALEGVLPQLATSLPNINFFVAPLVAFLTFLIIFKYLPDAQVAWRDAFVGALFTAVAFGIGALVIGQILIRTGTASIYGAASSLIVLLLWVYYSAIIVLYGSELTFVYAQRYGQTIVPSDSALYLADRYAQRREEREHTARAQSEAAEQRPT